MAEEDENWIYLDETLPEIHIREIVSLKELLEKNQNFVAFSDEEIYNQLAALFQDQDKDTRWTVDSFFKLHKLVTWSGDILDKYLDHIVYSTNAVTKDFANADNEKRYFETLEVIKKNLNYRIREQIRAELSEPLEAGEPLENDNHIPAPSGKRIKVSLPNGASAANGEGMKETLRLETDKETYEIYAGEFRKANYAQSMHIHERISSVITRVLSDIVLKVKDVDIVALRQNTRAEDTGLFWLFSKELVPSANYIIKQLGEHKVHDLRSLQVLFELHGRNLDDVDIDSMNGLVYAMQASVEQVDKAVAEAEEVEAGDEKGKSEKAATKIGSFELSYKGLHRLFWEGVLARVKSASDTSLYLDVINNAVAAILAKPFKAELYVPLHKQLENLANGSLKLEEFLQDIVLLKNLDERNLLSEFRDALLKIGGETERVRELEDAVNRTMDLVLKTIDPDVAEEMFTTKQFVREYVDKDAVQRPADLDDNDVQHIVTEETNAFVETLPENEDDVEIDADQDVDVLGIALEQHGNHHIAKVIGTFNEVLTRLQRLTNMPWDPAKFIRVLVQRAPPVISVGAAMLEVDSTIPKYIIDKVEQATITEAIDMLPIEKHVSVKTAYNKALLFVKRSRNNTFFVFMSYWILYVQYMMLQDLFIIQDITNSPCKNELAGIGYPIEEGRNGKKGVLNYFVCVLRDEGSDIPGISDLIDEYSKEQLLDKIKECFAYFSHDIEGMKQLAYTDVVYRGNLKVSEANEAYDTILKLRKKQFAKQDLLKPYIRSLQLMPSILDTAKDRNKHILGCCYARLDNSYLAANNLSNRLNASKNYFARERVGQQSRVPLVYYGVSAQTPEDVAERRREREREREEQIEAYTILEEAEVAEVVEVAEKITVPTDWRTRIKALPFFTDALRQIIDKSNRQEVSQIQNEGLRYFDALYRTINAQPDKGIWNEIHDMSVHELISTITQVCIDFYRYTQRLYGITQEAVTMRTAPAAPESIYRDEIALINAEIGKARAVVQLIKDTDIPNDDSGVLKVLLQFVLCRTLCMPGDVETNKKTVTITRVVKARFVQELAGYVTKELKRHIDNRAMPTLDDIDRKITELREKGKIDTMRRYEMNPELNKLVKQARLQGIRINTEEQEAPREGGEFDAPVPDMITEDDRADLEGALEFQMPSENPDEMDVDGFGNWN